VVSNLQALLIGVSHKVKSSVLVIFGLVVDQGQSVRFDAAIVVASRRAH